MENVDERRLNPRADVDWPINIFIDNKSVEGELKNISVDGIYITCDQPLRIDSKYRISILPPDHPSIGVTGQVIWSDFYGLDDDKSIFGMGICMVEIVEADKQYVEELIKKYL